MTSVYNLVTRRPHVPREKALRRILQSQGFDVELESPPKPGPTAGSDPPGDDSDEECDMMEEDEESEEFDDDESVCPTLCEEPPTGIWSLIGHFAIHV